MNRAHFALSSWDLTVVIRRCLAVGRDVEDVALVGNTVMRHLFSGLGVEPLSHAPFVSPTMGEQPHRRAGSGAPRSKRSSSK